MTIVGLTYIGAVRDWKFIEREAWKTVSESDTPVDQAHLSVFLAIQSLPAFTSISFFSGARALIGDLRDTSDGVRLVDVSLR